MGSNARFNNLCRIRFPAPTGVYEFNSDTRSVIGFADGEGTHNAENRYVARYRCNCVNLLYYSPDIRYEPWIMANGELMAPAEPKRAKFNPIIPYAAFPIATIDLTSSYQI